MMTQDEYIELLAENLRQEIAFDESQTPEIIKRPNEYDLPPLVKDIRELRSETGSGSIKTTTEDGLGKNKERITKGEDDKEAETITEAKVEDERKNEAITEAKIEPIDQVQGKTERKKEKEELKEDTKVDIKKDDSPISLLEGDLDADEYKFTEDEKSVIDKLIKEMEILQETTDKNIDVDEFNTEVLQEGEDFNDFLDDESGDDDLELELDDDQDDFLLGTEEDLIP